MGVVSIWLVSCADNIKTNTNTLSDIPSSNISTQKNNAGSNHTEIDGYSDTKSSEENCGASSEAERIPTLSPTAAEATEIRLHSLFVEGVILQRCQDIPIFGTGRPEGAQVTIILLKNEQIFRTATTQIQNGKWKTNLNSIPDSDATYRIQIKSISSKLFSTVSNIKAGEVWICSGQSNMAYPISATDVSITYDPLLRVAQIKPHSASQPQDNFASEFITAWKSDVNTLQNFSAVCYAFGQNLRSKLNVPVGLINSSVGGTYIEEWIPLGIVPTTHPMPGGQAYGNLFNSIIAPLIPYAFKGFVWYQGEANVVFPPGPLTPGRQYALSLSSFIHDLRERWGQGDFPTIIIQISSFGCLNAPKGDISWQSLRLGQDLAAQIIPASALVVSYEQGGLSRNPQTKQITNDSFCNQSPSGLIHPTRKNIIGQRVALAARKIAYNENILASGPTLLNARYLRGSAILKFTNIGNGLTTRPIGSSASGFSVCCDSANSYVPATAEIISPDTISVSSHLVPFPISVRYGWFYYVASTNEESLPEVKTYNIPLASLYNSDLLPLAPFSTDQNW